MYDTNNPGMEAVERKRWLNNNLPEIDSIKVVDWEIIHTNEQLERVKEQHLIDGYEGTIIRSYSEPYINKRTKHLRKIKEFITEEYIILDIISGKGNKSGIAGTVQIQVGDVVVGCGIRGSWDYCSRILNDKELIGQKATVRHFGKTPDGSLRFPVCIDINRPD